MSSQCTQILINVDKNSDGATTISDVFGILNDVLTLPYRVFHDAFSGTAVYDFFEIQPWSCFESTGQIVGGLGWIVITFLAAYLMDEIAFLTK